MHGLDMERLLDLGIRRGEEVQDNQAQWNEKRQCCITSQLVFAVSGW